MCAARKRSGAVPLLLIGSLGTISGCGESAVAVQRHEYVSREDCERDWTDERLCTPAPASNTSNGGTYLRFRGPVYYWDGERKLPMVLGADGVARPALGTRIGPSGSASVPSISAGTLERGGFGRLGLRFSGGS